MVVRSRFARTAVVVTVAATFATSAGAPAAASGKWSDGEVVRRPRHDSHAIQIEIGPRGYSVVAWVSGEPQAGPDVAGGAPEPDRRVWVSVRRRAGEQFRKPRALSGREVLGMQLDMARNGQTVVTWRSRRGRLMAAFRDADSGWTEPQRVTGPDQLSGELAVGPDGWAVLAWRVGVFGSGNERVKAAIRRPGGRFGRPMHVAQDPGIGNWGPTPAVGKHGRAMLVWTGVCPLNDPERRRRTRVSFLRRRAEKPSRWSGYRPIRNSKCPTAGAEVAMADEGRAVVALNGEFPVEWGGGIRVAVRRPGEQVGRARLISPHGRNANFSHVGISRGGRAVVGWAVFDRGSGRARGIQVAVVRKNGTFTRHRRVSPRRASLGALGVGARGHTVVLWHALDFGRIKGAYTRRAPAFGDPENVSAPLTTEALVQPAVAINSAGRAIAAWGRPDPRHGGEQGVFVSQRQLPAR